MNAFNHASDKFYIDDEHKTIRSTFVVDNNDTAENDTL